MEVYVVRSNTSGLKIHVSGVQISVLASDIRNINDKKPLCLQRGFVLAPID
jgi:hypothetical protein